MQTILNNKLCMCKTGMVLFAYSCDGDQILCLVDPYESFIFLEWGPRSVHSDGEGGMCKQLHAKILYKDQVGWIDIKNESSIIPFIPDR